jgi:hypothetical protein
VTGFCADDSETSGVTRCWGFRDLRSASSFSTRPLCPVELISSTRSKVAVPVACDILASLGAKGKINLARR